MVVLQKTPMYFFIQIQNYVPPFPRWLPYLLWGLSILGASMTIAYWILGERKSFFNYLQQFHQWRRSILRNRYKEKTILSEKDQLKIKEENALTVTNTRAEIQKRLKNENHATTLEAIRMFLATITADTKEEVSSCLKKFLAENDLSHWKDIQCQIYDLHLTVMGHTPGKNPRNFRIVKHKNGWQTVKGVDST